MIISSGRRYVFVHIPKTGGTAMATALETRAMRDDILIGDTPKALRRRARLKSLTSRGRLWKHATLSDVEGVVSPEQMADWFVFTLVRNPWDRMVSYYHWLRAQGFDHPAVRIAQATGFDGFLADPRIADSLRTAPYAAYVTDSGGTERARAFIRLEHLDEDAQPLWRHLGFRLDLPVVNTSQRDRDYRRYYTPDTAARVAAICAPDIARFGYAFDPAPGG